MYKIHCLNNISEKGTGLLTDAYQLTDDMSEATGVLVRSAAMHDMEFPESLLAIGRAGAGVNNIPLDRCADEGIVVFNSPGANANAVKELVVCGMLLASRGIVGGIDWCKENADDENIGKSAEKAKKAFAGNEILGKKLGVIGLGAIGVMVANAAVSMGMDVVGYDPFISVESAWHMSRAVHRAIDIDTLLSKSDYVTVHVPLMDKTKNYLSTPEISKMKDGVIVLNFARNGIVKNSSILDALESGKVAKYVVDFPEAEMLGKKNVIAIPHLGASTPESEENCAMMAADELRKFLETGSIEHSVNLPNCVLAPPVHNRITLIHKNLPNMVGQMTAILSRENLNIEEMVNKSRGNVAYTVFDLNQMPNDDTLRELGSIDGMIRIRQIN